MVDPENQTTYTCKVQDGGETPLVSTSVSSKKSVSM